MTKMNGQPDKMDKIITFAQNYANKKGYSIDAGAVLAVYARVDMLQNEGQTVTSAEVKEMVNSAIEHSENVGQKQLMKKIFGRKKDKDDRIILSEQDF